MNDKLKVDLTLPEWASEKSMIFIVGGNEILARYKFKEIGWEIKSARCSQCGQCCLESKPDWLFYDPDKGCKYLEPMPGEPGRYNCLHPEEPWSCVRGSGGGKGKCTVRFKKVE